MTIDGEHRSPTREIGWGQRVRSHAAALLFFAGTLFGIKLFEKKPEIVNVPAPAAIAYDAATDVIDSTSNEIKESNSNTELAQSLVEKSICVVPARHEFMRLPQPLASDQMKNVIIKAVVREDASNPDSRVVAFYARDILEDGTLGLEDYYTSEEALEVLDVNTN